ncbi:Lipoprotein [Shewanella benthica]|uniref:Lipoprotein n=2 Tax=Shewanella benthica TaxID=43661 RepID=A0A330M1K3_9GAMM|nr:Lipoprotein [Shewanella benthica]
MKLQIITLSLLALTLSLSACSEQETTTQDSVQQTQKTSPVGDTSRTSLDWDGTYSGVTPCASCSGIDTTLTLKLDNTYVLETRYLGDENEAKKVFTEAGSFEWNSEGNKISLLGDASRKDDPEQYQVGENQLLMLDMQGNRITGSLAELYRLAKQDPYLEQQQD